jgi:DNA primase
VGVVDEDIAAVKAATDLVGVVGQYTQGKQVGRRWVGLCPFHAEKSPSFSVNREDGLFYCFGCQKSGDSITFVREIEHLDFVGAVEWLAARTGVTVRYTSDDEGASRQRRKRLHDAMGRAVDWYHDRLLTGPDAGAARGYLRSRGYDGDTVRRYRLGWAPAGWDELVRALKLPDDVLVATGLGFKNRSGRSTDAFRGRLLFPIFDPEGHPVALGGRVLPGGEGPKYKNSPETELYSKSRILYGLNWHKGEIVGHGAAGEVIVCEGYTDVIGFARADIGRAVATCGTALTEDHVKLLARFAKRIVLAFDADAAGQGAADRFAAWEQRYDLEVCVADLPAGLDPGDLAQKDPDRLRGAVERLAEWRPGAVGAKPYLAFRLDRVLAAADLASVEGRARAATAGVDVLRGHPNELVRDAYLMKLADFCRVEVTQLRSQLAQRARTRVPAAGFQEAPSRRRPGDGQRHPAELEALVLLVQQRDDMLPWLSDELFVDDRHLAVFWALAAEPDVAAALGLLQEADPGAAEILAAVAVAESEAEPADVGARLLELAGHRRLGELQAEARVAADPLTLAEPTARLRLALQSLRDPAAAATAAAEVLEAIRTGPAFADRAAAGEH